jgi:serine/threonine protein kinase
VLIEPGYGLPKGLKGHSLKHLIADVAVTSVSIYPCPLRLSPEKMCTGDHFLVARDWLVSVDVTALMTNGGDMNDEEWRTHLQSLVAAAKIMPQSKNLLESSAAQNLEVQQLTRLLEAYYSATQLPETVVVPDTVASLLNDSAVYHTKFSCALGYDNDSPLCALCSDESSGSFDCEGCYGDDISSCICTLDAHNSQYAGGSTSHCVFCEDSVATGGPLIKVLFAIALGWVALVLVPAAIFRISRDKMASEGKASGREGFQLVQAGAEESRASVFVYGKIVVSHFQLLLQFPIVLDMTFPDGFQQMLNMLALLKGELLSYLNIKCAVDLDLYGEFSISMLFVPTTLLWFYGLQILGRSSLAVHWRSINNPCSRNGVAPMDSLLKSEPPAVDGNGDGLLNKLFIILFCVYPFLATRICHMFQCEQLKSYNSQNDPDVESWHLYDFEIDCYSQTYLNFAKAAYVMIAVYPIGGPCFAGWIFAKNWRRLFSTNTAPAKSALSDSHTFDESPPWWHGDRTTFYFMVRDYKPHFFYFEIVEFLRKFALTGILMTVTTRGSAAQIVLGIVIALFFWGLNCIVQPYADPRTNFFRILADSSLVITLLIILVLHFKTHLYDEGGCEQLTEQNLQWALIFVNFVLLLAAASQESLRRAYNIYRTTQLLGIMYDPEGRLADGVGANATVYRGSYQATASSDVVMCAVKVRGADPDIEVVESSLMLNCAHRNIVNMYRTERCGHMSYLAMEMCASSLQSVIRRNQPDAEPLDTVGICKAIAEGVGYLHTQNFVHGNITPANILLCDGEPKLSGFSNARVIEQVVVGRIERNVATKMWTMRGTLGYQPPELFGRKQHLMTEVQDPVALDVFGLGCTMLFVLSDGRKPFSPNGDDEDIELNILSGKSGIAEDTSLLPEAKHLLSSMVKVSPSDRTTIAAVFDHPLFWTAKAKLEYMGETIGMVLPSKVRKIDHPFIADLEQALDTHLGLYNEAEPAQGGSWSRKLDSRYPLGGDWGKSQRPPQDEEHGYYVYGQPPSKKQAEQREAAQSAGKMTKAQAPKEIRSVGLLRFIRNMNAHRLQQVEANRFESEEAVIQYLLEPFPWLLAAVYAADERHRLSTLFAEECTTAPPAFVAKKKASPNQNQKSKKSKKLQVTPSASMDSLPASASSSFDADQQSLETSLSVEHSRGAEAAHASGGAGVMEVPANPLSTADPWANIWSSDSVPSVEDPGLSDDPDGLGLGASFAPTVPAWRQGL